MHRFCGTWYILRNPHTTHHGRGKHPAKLSVRHLETDNLTICADSGRTHDKMAFFSHVIVCCKMPSTDSEFSKIGG